MKTNQQEENTGNGYSNNKTFDKVLIATLLIFVGIVMIGRNMGYFNTTLFHVIMSWQMFLIIIGIALLFKRNFWGGFTVLGIGIIFLFHGFSKWIFALWPAIFIIIGLKILFKRKQRPGHWRRTGSMSRYSQENYSSESGYVICDNTFGSIQQIVLDPVFKGAELKNLFGGTILDLRRTKLEAAETYIDVDCTFGGIEVYLPSNWRVRTQVNALIGGCDDKRYGAGIEIDPEHTLVIRGNITFGGLEIKS